MLVMDLTQPYQRLRYISAVSPLETPRFSGALIMAAEASRKAHPAIFPQIPDRQFVR